MTSPAPMTGSLTDAPDYTDALETSLFKWEPLSGQRDHRQTLAFKDGFDAAWKTSRRATPNDAGLLEQHARDSAELRRLCEARDEARRTAEHWKAEHLAGNKEIARLTAELEAAKRDASQFRTALQHLVYLKDHKDRYGKDKFYELQQPIAWDVARDFLSASSDGAGNGGQS